MMAHCDSKAILMVRDVRETMVVVATKHCRLRSKIFLPEAIQEFWKKVQKQWIEIVARRLAILNYPGRKITAGGHKWSQ